MTKRELLPSRFIVALEFMLPEAATTETVLLQAIARVEEGIRAGHIALDVGDQLLTQLFKAFRSNDHMHDVMRLVRESGLDVAMVEVNRVEKQRREAKQHGK